MRTAAGAVVAAAAVVVAAGAAAAAAAAEVAAAVAVAPAARLQLLGDVVPGPNSSRPHTIVSITPELVVFQGYGSSNSPSAWGWLPQPLPLPPPQPQTQTPLAPGLVVPLQQLYPSLPASLLLAVARTSRAPGLSLMTAYTPATGYEPWWLLITPNTTNNTTTNTTGAAAVVPGVPLVEVWLAADVAAGAAGSDPGPAVWLEGAAYFAAQHEQYGRELWRLFPPSQLPPPYSTAAGAAAALPVGAAELVSDLCPGACSSDPQDLTMYRGKLYFRATDRTHGAELWVLCPPPADTAAVAVAQLSVVDIIAGPVSSGVRGLTLFKNHLYFIALITAAPANWRLWRLDGGDSGDENVPVPVAVAVEPQSTRLSFMRPPVATGDTALFIDAGSDTNGRQLWVYRPQLDNNTDSNSSANSSDRDQFPDPLVPPPGVLSLIQPAGGQRLSLETGPAAEPLPPTPVHTGPGGRWMLFFSGGDTSVAGQRPWVSDGTAAGTYPLPPFENTWQGSYTAYGSGCFLTIGMRRNASTSASAAAVGGAITRYTTELWWSDGVGSVPVPAVERAGLEVFAPSILPLSPSDPDAATSATSAVGAASAATDALYFSGCDAAAGLFAPGIGTGMGCEPYRLLLLLLPPG